MYYVVANSSSYNTKAIFPSSFFIYIPFLGCCYAKYMPQMHCFHSTVTHIALLCSTVTHVAPFSFNRNSYCTASLNRDSSCT